MKLLLILSLALAATGLLAQTHHQGGEKSAAGASADPAAIARGKAIYKQICAICHYSASSAKKIGPGLKDLSKRRAFADGKPVNDATLRAWMEKGGKDMPGFKDVFNAEQLRDLIAYLKTL